MKEKIIQQIANCETQITFHTNMMLKYTGAKEALIAALAEEVAPAVESEVVAEPMTSPDEVVIEQQVSE